MLSLSLLVWLQVVIGSPHLTRTVPGLGSQHNGFGSQIMLLFSILYGEIMDLRKAKRNSAERIMSLEKQIEDVQLLSEYAVRVKHEMEEDYLEKFVHILNSKKDHIRQLRTENEELTRQKERALFAASGLARAKSEADASFAPAAGGPTGLRGANRSASTFAPGLERVESPIRELSDSDNEIDLSGPPRNGGGAAAAAARASGAGGMTAAELAEIERAKQREAEFERREAAKRLAAQKEVTTVRVKKEGHNSQPPPPPPTANAASIARDRPRRSSSNAGASSVAAAAAQSAPPPPVTVKPERTHSVDKPRISLAAATAATAAAAASSAAGATSGRITRSNSNSGGVKNEHRAMSRARSLAPPSADGTTALSLSLSLDPADEDARYASMIYSLSESNQTRV